MDRSRKTMDREREKGVLFGGVDLGRLAVRSRQLRMSSISKNGSSKEASSNHRPGPHAMPSQHCSYMPAPLVLCLRSKDELHYIYRAEGEREC